MKRRLALIALGLPAVLGMALFGTPRIFGDSAGGAHTAAVSSHAGMTRTPWGTWITQKQNTWYHTHPVYVSHRGPQAKPGTVSEAAQFEYFGYWCAYSNATGCINNIGGGGAHTKQGYWDKSTAGKNGQFSQYWYGNVSSSWPGGGFPDGNYSNNAVYAYFWTPNRSWTGLAEDSELLLNGNIVLDNECDCAGQWWVWDGNNRWVGVLSTAAEYAVGDNISVYYGYGNGGVSNGQPALNSNVYHSIRVSLFIS